MPRRQIIGEHPQEQSCGGKCWDGFLGCLRNCIPFICCGIEEVVRTLVRFIPGGSVANQAIENIGAAGEHAVIMAIDGSRGGRRASVDDGHPVIHGGADLVETGVDSAIQLGRVFVTSAADRILPAGAQAPAHLVINRMAGDVEAVADTLIARAEHGAVVALERLSTAVHSSQERIEGVREHVGQSASGVVETIIDIGQAVASLPAAIGAFADQAGVDYNDPDPETDRSEDSDVADQSPRPESNPEGTLYSTLMAGPRMAAAALSILAPAAGSYNVSDSGEPTPSPAPQVTDSPLVGDFFSQLE